MRYYRKGWVPPYNRVLLVESGSRALLDRMLSHIYQQHGPETPVDVITCYSGTPQALNHGTGKVFRVHDYGPEDRHRLLRELLDRNYTILGILCSAEPIMTKWKWWLGYKIPAKLLIINENCDYFYVDLPHWRIILHFLLIRAGLTGPRAVSTLARLAFFPFTLTYLLIFAGWVHLKRRIRMALGQ